jgi:hypothetical protein
MELSIFCENPCAVIAHEFVAVEAVILQEEIVAIYALFVVGVGDGDVALKSGWKLKFLMRLTG